MKSPGPVVINIRGGHTPEELEGVYVAVRVMMSLTKLPYVIQVEEVTLEDGSTIPERWLGPNDVHTFELKTEHAPLSIDEFRREVKDKLGVVFHGANLLPLLRSIARRQCEDFLVELYAAATKGKP